MRRMAMMGLVLAAAQLLPDQITASSDRASVSSLPSLVVMSDPGGGVRAMATIFLPAPPAIIQSILTEYRKWPELFEVRMRLAGLEEQPGSVVVTDLYIEHALMPGERRLLCESHPLPGGGLATDLKGGDFKRYHRVWKLAPFKDGRETRAEFELVVEIDTILPDWVIAMAMRKELEAHFRIVTQRSKERMGKEK